MRTSCRSLSTLMSLAFGAALFSIPAPGRAQAGAMGGESASVDTPPNPLTHRAPHPLSPEAARTWIRLQKAIDFSFATEKPLEEVLKYIETQTEDSGKNAKEAPAPDDGLKIYVDPVGLQEAEKTMTSPITLALKKIPVATGLTLVLNQLGLAFSVQKDGIVIINSASSEDRPEDDAPVTSTAARTWLKLHEPVTLGFDETAFSDVIKTLRDTTSGGEFRSGLPFYVDPDDLEKVGCTFESKVSLQLENMPLAGALDLIAKQVGLVYRVRDDGIVVIQRTDDRRELLREAHGFFGSGKHGPQTLERLKAVVEEAKLMAEIAKYRAQAGFPMYRPGMGGGMGSFGGMGGQSGMMGVQPK